MSVWKKQLTRTPDRKRNEQQTRRITKKSLRSMLPRRMRASDTRLQWLFDQTHGDVMDTAMLYHTALERRAKSSGKAAADERGALQYRKLRKQLRETRLTLARISAPTCGTVTKETKARVRGVVRLVDKGGMPIDTMYEQLRADLRGSLLPGGYHPSRPTGWKRIAEIAESLKAVVRNPYANGIARRRTSWRWADEYAAQARSRGRRRRRPRARPHPRPERACV